MPFLRPFTLLLFVLLSLPAFGQRQTITLTEAIDIALRQNTTLQSAENLLDLAQAERTQAYTSLLPNLSVNSQFSRTTGRQFIDELDRLVSETTQGVGAGLSSNVTLFDGFGNIATVRQAEYLADAEYETVARTRQTVIFTVADQFLQVLLDRELLDIAEENAAAADTQLILVREQVDLGLVSNADLYQQEAEFASRRVAVIDARTNLQVDESLLVQTLQLDPLTDYTFVGPDLEAILPIDPVDDLEPLLQAAFERRPDLEAGRFAIRAAREGVRAARASYWPAIGAFFSIGTRYNDADTTPFEDQFLRDNRSRSLGFSVSIPLFDRLATRTAAQRRRIQRRNAELLLRDLEHTVVVEVKRAYFTLSAARERVDATFSQRQAARQALDAALERYSLGAATYVELRQANAAYVEAAAIYAQARFTLAFQRLILDYYTGALDGTITF